MVTLTVTDSYGFSDDYSASVTVYPNPVANFMFMPACDGQPVQFTDLSYTNGGGVIVSWEWNFGDPASGSGNTSNLQNPVHFFTGPGNYQVILSITSSYGCLAEITKPVTVHPQSAGGSVSGSNTIVFGQNTGPLSLSGNTGTVIKWQKQHDGGGFADIPGTAGMTTYSEFPVYPGTWEYRASVQSGSCASQYSLPATVTVSDPPGGDSKTWTGASGENWNEPGNWSPAGVPVYLDNIVIPASVPNMPRVSINGFECSDVTILHGAILTIDPDFSLTINGHLVME